jgi:hypothetical protein
MKKPEKILKNRGKIPKIGEKSMKNRPGWRRFSN